MNKKSISEQKIQWKPLIISLFISLGLPFLTNLFTSNVMESYENQYKPFLSPPGWVFPVVWTILYILMGIAAYRIYISDSPDRNSALKLYFIQLIVNIIWPFLFFNLNAYLLSLAWLILLWYLVYLTIKRFWAIDQTAAKLMIPYLIWLTFAAYLNLAIAINSFI